MGRGARLLSLARCAVANRGRVGGGGDDRLYPWGDAKPDDMRVFVSGRTGVTGPVGARPTGASPFDVLDLSGSLAEWTSTLKRSYPYDAADGRESPPAAWRARHPWRRLHL